MFGWHEGRDPSAVFSTNGYLTTYTDVAADGGNPLQHYLQFGMAEGRSPTRMHAAGTVLRIENRSVFYSDTPAAGTASILKAAAKSARV
jgi:hypothetical protein